MKHFNAAETIFKILTAVKFVLHIFLNESILKRSKKYKKNCA